MTFNRLRTLIHDKISTGEFEINKENELFSPDILTEEISMFSNRLDKAELQCYRYEKGNWKKPKPKRNNFELKARFGSIQIPRRTTKHSSLMDIPNKKTRNKNTSYMSFGT